MRKTDLDHLLEAAVAKALGVPVPRLARKPARSRKTMHQPIRHAA